MLSVRVAFLEAYREQSIGLLNKCNWYKKRSNKLNQLFRITNKIFSNFFT